MLKTEDQHEQEIWEAVRGEAAKVLDEMLDSLARKIVKEYGEAKKRGQQRSK